MGTITRRPDRPVMADPRDAYVTEVSAKCKALAEAFNAQVEGVAGWRLEMTRPGLSTVPGKPHPQKLILRAEDGRHPIVVGTVSVSERSAELRTYHDVIERNRQRSDEPLPITFADFYQHVDSATALLGRASINVSPVIRSGPLGPAPSIHPAVASGPRAGLLLIVGVATTTVVLALVSSLT